ncbi:unnamed protein product [Spirodela intermedia]|uniref:Pectinesterase inhibitor domain-containing protein n=1 Tax=Spirodela intermedia TaxID=51605 RepID=A0A7I8J9R3_SPIIN|nr:unnamed protein product [Spirodela intermedia]CAA6666820.1 unnamed protein product [Spirodela intermedia]
MERVLLAAVFLTLFSTCAGAGAGAALHPDVDFIRTSCRSTRYPALCEHSLTGFAGAVRRNPRQLAQTALAVTIYRARSASTFVGHLMDGARKIRSREAGAVRDCIENVSDSVDRLRRSVAEFGRMGKPGTPSFAWHLSNVQTWVSAALTDETTCLDGFSGTNVDAAMKTAIRRKIVGLAQETSNALALVNRIAARH